MADNATATVELSTVFTLTQNNTPLASTNVSQSYRTSLTYTFGSGESTINDAYVGIRTLASGVGEDIDLSGSLTNLLNQSLTYTRVRHVVFEVVSGTTSGTAISQVNIFASGSNFYGPLLSGTNGLNVKLGNAFQASENTSGGWPVTNSTADIIRVYCPGPSTTYRVTVLGQE